MRARNLIIVILVIGTIAYTVVFQRQLLLGVFTQARQVAAGYTPATTPEDAMDRFARAIKVRDYESAALYVRGEYADYLRKRTQLATIGADVDSLASLSKDRGIHTDTVLYVLMTLDPFPGGFKRPSGIDLKKEMKDGKETGNYIGRFAAEPITLRPRTYDVRGLDLRMFRNALMPPTVNNVPAFNYTVRIVPEGEGSNKTWKLAIPLDNITRDEINHFINNYKKYDNALIHLLDSARMSGSYDSGQAFESDVIETLGKQN